MLSAIKQQALLPNLEVKLNLHAWYINTKKVTFTQNNWKANLAE